MVGRDHHANNIFFFFFFSFALLVSSFVFLSRWLERNKNKNGESIPYPQSDYSQKLVRMVDNHLIFIFSTSFPCSFLLVALCGGGRIPCLRECV
jgi:hypothetical protein